jgi:hypothetical protein
MLDAQLAKLLGLTKRAHVASLEQRIGGSQSQSCNLKSCFRYLAFPAFLLEPVKKPKMSTVNPSQPPRARSIRVLCEWVGNHEPPPARLGINSISGQRLTYFVPPSDIICASGSIALGTCRDTSLSTPASRSSSVSSRLPAAREAAVAARPPAAGPQSAPCSCRCCRSNNPPLTLPATSRHPIAQPSASRQLRRRASRSRATVRGRLYAASLHA